MSRLARSAALAVALVGSSIALSGQAPRGLDPKTLLKPGPDVWPTYNGDYSGRRFSTLDKINTTNIDALTLAWVFRLNAGPGAGNIKGTPLQINGVIYLTAPDNVWALDARTGRELWHHTWQSTGGIHIGNRGAAVLGEWLYYETPDCHLVSLNIKDGSERWHKQICDLDQFYYGSVAPVVVGNHVIAGVSGDDLDVPGYIQAHDPETGEMQWRWWAVPQKMGDPGSETWPNEEAMKHGGGMTWQPVTYDPDLNLIFVTTGNPQPVIAHSNRAGDNLFTASIVALNPDTGKMAWYFQSSPHDTHDWDSTQTPVLIRRPDQRPAAQAPGPGGAQRAFLRARSDDRQGAGLDRVRQDQLGEGLRRERPAGPESGQAPTGRGRAGVARSRWRDQLAASQLQPADRPFLRQRLAGLQRLLPLRPVRESARLGRDGSGGYSESMIQAIDYKTGNVKWSHKWEANIRSGLLSTAGNLLFAGGPSTDIVALNATTGDALWHARLGAAVSNGPTTYLLDGTQYLVVGAGDTLWAFAMQHTHDGAKPARGR